MHGAKKLLARVLLCLGTMAGLNACDNDPGARTEDQHRFDDSLTRIEGSVYYRERIALPRNAEVEVELADITDPETPTLVVSSGPIRPQGGPPHNFHIPIQLANLDLDKWKSRRYGLRATIHSDGRLMFVSKGYVAVNDADPKQILVERIPTENEPAAITLESTHWGLHTLGGAYAETGAGGRQIDIRFIDAEKRAAGFSGCNRYSGSYSLEGGDGESLSFGPVAGTRMACRTGSGDIEIAYLRMLNQVTTYRLQGDTLVLLAEDEILASFKPI